MHPKNLHNNPYQFDQLIDVNPALSKFVFINDFGTQTIDFSIQEAVLQLNKALLKKHYGVTDWEIPPHYLCPAVPGRADYIHYISDLLSEENLTGTINGLDIGVGANCIYPILGSQIYNWKMVGSDIDLNAIASAKNNVSLTKDLSKTIEIRHQTNNANIFEGVILKDEYFHFTMCNPPFYSSEEEVTKVNLKKLNNLNKDSVNNNRKQRSLNFAGQANELWCNGGEALFIKRMIKQSINFKTQVLWFSTLVSRKENLNKFYKQLDKLKATHRTIKMDQGNKKSRLLFWKY